ncbi:hypothetical protein [Thiolapillus brandeum]|uniref:Uncharacterized protein n=1 Tax=Thiolapillus brandeum TaxID=1076588 RepID=A0A7U6GH84_9GAMM|nr:hypothetical protein [Thiolapillus brandeum]BAO43609.1 hypothetical protein TBH_C0671 [Thiolapillus brandeum]
MKTASRSAWTAALILLWALFARTQAASFGGQAPQALCDQAGSLGIMGTPRYQYQSGGLWECSSVRKKLPQGEPASVSDLQYRVQGTQNGVGRVLLELRMRSYRQPQGVLRAFADVADKLFQTLFQRALPGDLRESILGPVEGEWQFDGHRVMLRKQHSKGSVYDLWLILEES